MPGGRSHNRFSFVFSKFVPRRLPRCWTTIALALLLPPFAAEAGDIDTEHIFGFMIGTDVGHPGEREFQSATTGRFGKSGKHYRAGGQEFELEFVPVDNVRIEVGSTVAAFDIAALPGLPDRRTLGWQGASLDFRYRFLDRDKAGIGVTLALEAGIDRLDDTRGSPIRGFDTGIVLAFDRELVPGIAVASFNLIYQPGWTRDCATQFTERDSNVGAAMGLLSQLRPGVLFGGEARYLRRYEGIGLTELAGQALFAGPTLYLQLSDRSRLTASWSAQVWGRTAEPGPAALDLVNYERRQARVVYGINF
jgi:hypothetical protein